MKKYQLIGRKKELMKSKPTREYPSAHIHSLPYEILCKVFENLEDDKKTILSISLSCKKFNNIINKNFLYQRVNLRGFRNFHKFTVAHAPTSNSFTKRLQSSQSSSSSKINLINAIEVSNPPSSKTEHSKIKIAGSYDVENISRRGQQNDYQEFVTSLSILLRESYSIKNIVIYEIPPSFEFPDFSDINASSGSSSTSASSSTSSSIFSSWRQRNPPKRTLHTLTLKPQSGWSIPFKSTHISSIANIYDSIDELVLHNFVVDEFKLNSASGKHKPISINVLTLHACTFILSNNRPQNKKRSPSPIFQNVTHLKLLNLLSGKDLSVIDFIKSNNILSKITIDFDSPIFFDSSSPNSSFNFARYNLFFKLLCSGIGAYSNVKELELINFSLLDCYGHLHHLNKQDEEEEDDWVEPSTDTFNSLLKFLSSIPKLTIHLKERPDGHITCVNCGTTKDTTRPLKSTEDWSAVLKPLLLNNIKCDVEIFDNRGISLFKRGVCVH